MKITTARFCAIIKQAAENRLQCSIHIKTIGLSVWFPDYAQGKLKVCALHAKSGRNRCRAACMMLVRTTGTMGESFQLCVGRRQPPAGCKEVFFVQGLGQDLGWEAAAGLLSSFIFSFLRLCVCVPVCVRSGFLGFWVSRFPAPRVAYQGRISP